MSKKTHRVLAKNNLTQSNQVDLLKKEIRKADQKIKILRKFISDYKETI
jgi:hypothetical protein